MAGAALAAVVVAVPVGVLCVRYVKIYFGMLTLAFGMLFYSFLYKFYALTGGDEGIRVLRPTLLGQPFAGLDKVDVPDRPLLLLRAGAAGRWPRWSCGASSARRSGCACAPSARIPPRPSRWASACGAPLLRLRDRRGVRRRRRHAAGGPDRAGRSASSPTGRTPGNLVFMPCSVASPASSGRSSAPRLHLPPGPVMSAHALLALRASARCWR